jgi:hypothetical protein
MTWAHALRVDLVLQRGGRNEDGGEREDVRHRRVTLTIDETDPTIRFSAVGGDDVIITPIGFSSWRNGHFLRLGWWECGIPLCSFNTLHNPITIDVYYRNTNVVMSLTKYKGCNLNVSFCVCYRIGAKGPSKMITTLLPFRKTKSEVESPRGEV